ncbi:hypothetical protein BDV3_002356 [Batrachochytrium dendrobatidis]|uniref:LsmAD domain-containing protein n=1 Tax=Batrachochytrium dendrobatidis (strain JEL423) TaxID=403673 RepID=A0A177WWH8_BATDL|nr:hypothetical protein BDEG_27661 [Batrachochytrium dendrobatidis JEL423]
MGRKPSPTKTTGPFSGSISTPMGTTQHKSQTPTSNAMRSQPQTQTRPSSNVSGPTPQIPKATKANAWSAGPPVMAVSDSMTPAVSVAAAKTNGSRTNSTQKSPSAKMSAKERALNAVLQLVGVKTLVTTLDGSEVEGICHTVDPVDLSVSLRQARKRVLHSKGTGRAIAQLNIRGADVVSITAASFETARPPRTKVSHHFKTDTAISGGAGEHRYRNLTKWTSDNANEQSMTGLEDVPKSGTWDQFATNKRLFGVTTDFDEHMYTTVVDKSLPGFSKREAEAARIAAEIERAPTRNLHVAEERGFCPTDSTMDEEDRYSSVLRNVTQGNRKPTNTSWRSTVAPASTHKQSTVGATFASIAEKNAPQSTAGTGTTFASIVEKNARHSHAPQSTPDPTVTVQKLFSEFAGGERKQWQVRREQIHRTKQGGLLDDLKKFGNSFKLQTPMPEDIKCILHMDAKKESNNIEQSQLLQDKSNKSDKPETSSDRASCKTNNRNAASDAHTKNATSGTPSNDIKKNPSTQNALVSQKNTADVKANVESVKHLAVSKSEPNPVVSDTTSNTPHDSQSNPSASLATTCKTNAETKLNTHPTACVTGSAKPDVTASAQSNVKVPKQPLSSCANSHTPTPKTVVSASLKPQSTQTSASTKEPKSETGLPRKQSISQESVSENARLSKDEDISDKVSTVSETPSNGTSMTSTSKSTFKFNVSASEFTPTTVSNAKPPAVSGVKPTSDPKNFNYPNRRGGKSNGTPNARMHTKPYQGKPYQKYAPSGHYDAHQIGGEFYSGAGPYPPQPQYDPMYMPHGVMYNPSMVHPGMPAPAMMYGMHPQYGFMPGMHPAGAVMGYSHQPPMPPMGWVSSPGEAVQYGAPVMIVGGTMPSDMAGVPNTTGGGPSSGSVEYPTYEQHQMMMQGHAPQMYMQSPYVQYGIQDPQNTQLPPTSPSAQQATPYIVAVQATSPQGSQ